MAAPAEDSPTLRLDLDSRPEALTLVRGMLGGIAELLAVDRELLDDLKTAVSEACNNVVLHAYDGTTGPLQLSLYVAPEAIDVIIRDEGKGISRQAPSDQSMQGVGIPVIQALAERAEFRIAPDGGTEVRMSFASERDGERLFQHPAPAAPDDGWAGRFAGDAVVTLSPLNLLGGVLGRLARALAARSRFSLDRFSDVYLVTDALAAHASSAASGPRVGFCVVSQERRLEITIGPLRAGASARLQEEHPTRTVDSALVLLSDELEIRSVNGDEELHLVMLDQHQGEPPNLAADR